MNKASKKRGPVAKRRSERRAPLQKPRQELRFTLTKLSLARAAFGSVMSKVCPPGAHHLSDTLDGVVKVLTHYTNEKYSGPTP